MTIARFLADNFPAVLVVACIALFIYTAATGPYGRKWWGK